METELTYTENQGVLAQQDKNISQSEMERGDNLKSHDLPYSDLSVKQTKREAVSSNGPTRRVQNIVIDIESDELSYGQARSIRLQIQRDVEQLRNRVRMLQQEEVRAIKKIDETRKKTKQIQELQQRNDSVFIKRMQEEQKRRDDEERLRKVANARKELSTRDVRVKGNELTQNKLALASEVKQQKMNDKAAMLSIKAQFESEAREKSRQIIDQKRIGLQKQNEFVKKKVQEARADVKKDAEKLKNQLKDFESEAVQLERMEAELLLKLQQTQKQERDAFGRLENAMVDASIPKHLRV